MATETLPIGMRDGVLVPLASAMRRRTPGRFGEHEIVTPLARGGMASVYLAAHAGTGERVALKVLDPAFATSPDLAARLVGEHAIAARACHPGLLAVHAAGHTDEQVPYLVMEYLEGETLAQLAARGPLDLAEVAAIGAQIASALAALHIAGIVHCDVKHENVFVLAGERFGDSLAPRIKVIDFGVSREIDAPADPDATIVGTPWCMAPEQWTGAPVAASDVYALGCLLYELTTGTPPFDGSLPELMTAHLEQRPARPSWLRTMPIDLERVILRALAKDPAARPPMAQLADELFELHDAWGPPQLARAS